MVNIVSPNRKKKTYLLSSGAYHYSTETYSRVRNFGNNHTFKLSIRKKIYNSLTAA